ncbi:PR domain zinc finger protein 2 [Lampris incognitus]|uniref:PR domain zinc finger protein 2 n=1 Tax=Lampris incognitus TaxID=2546036 RepID=UPI0024B49DB5|nr:PR domain zinc finger protein 2 [Lampris incognitus]
MFTAPLLSLVALAVTMQLYSSTPIREPVPAAVEGPLPVIAEELLQDVVAEPVSHDSVPLDREHNLDKVQELAPEEPPPKEMTPAVEEEAILKEPPVVSNTVTTEDPAHKQHNAAFTEGPIPALVGEPIEPVEGEAILKEPLAVVSYTVTTEDPAHEQHNAAITEGPIPDVVGEPVEPVEEEVILKEPLVVVFYTGTTEGPAHEQHNVAITEGPIPDLVGEPVEPVEEEVILKEPLVVVSYAFMTEDSAHEQHNAATTEEPIPDLVGEPVEEEAILKEPLVVVSYTVTTEDPAHVQHNAAITEGPIPDLAGEPVPQEPAEEKIAIEDTVFEDAPQGEIAEELVQDDAKGEAVEEAVKEELPPEEIILTIPEESALNHRDATQETIPDQPTPEQPFVGISTETTAQGETIPQEPVQIIPLETSEKDEGAVQGEKNLEESDISEEAEPDGIDLSDLALFAPEDNTTTVPSDTMASERAAFPEGDIPVTLTVATVLPEILTEAPAEPIMKGVISSSCVLRLPPSTSMLLSRESGQMCGYTRRATANNTTTTPPPPHRGSFCKQLLAGWNNKQTAEERQADHVWKVMAINGETVETLNEIPPHVWRGLPDCMSLRPSAVNQSRIGVWATQIIPKGKRFGPFVGEKKKRSQVTSNLYMWEVYFPARGWMCVDATDPMMGNWLRYVNWARSTEEQNLFPLEINRTIYYKVLRPIGPGEELLVWYSGEDNPEITAALEEERVSSLSKKNSPRTRRAKRKQLERARQAGLGGFKQTSKAKPIISEMWDGEEGPKEENERPMSPGPSHAAQEASPMRSTDHTDMQDMPVIMTDDGDGQNAEEEEDDKVNEAEDPGVLLRSLPPTQTPHQSSEGESMKTEQPDLLLNCSDTGEESSKDLQFENDSASLPGQEQEADPDLDLDPDPDGELEGDLHEHEELHPCQHCERHFSTKQGLERHIHIHATANQQTHVFKCCYCGKTFGSQVGRRRHERRHESGPKKRPGSLAGTATLLSPVPQTDASSPDCTSPARHYIAIGSQFSGAPLHHSEVMRKELGPADTDRPLIIDENGESKELHPCKYCNKAFGTHTNMRRHQRRIHERHLLPKGVRRKGMLLQEASVQQQQPPQPDESSSTSPPPVYVPSADTEDEADRDDYVVDISKNISENLSYYIDGKILSNNSVSTCEVIEVDSRSTALLGLDAVIISPNQISQALKVEGRTNAVKQVSNIGQPTSKRRTSTPPLIPNLKMEMDAGSPTTSSSSSSTSSSSNLLVGGVFPQSTESAVFQREKTIYLSPKLKQLLQTQDSQKSTIAGIADSHRLPSPLSVTLLPGASGRFKRRTTSPPSSPQLSPVLKSENCITDTKSLYTIKVPNLESHSVLTTGSHQGKDEGDTMNPSLKDTCGRPATSSGGNACNQQPLDLSSSVGRRGDSLNKVLGDSALDLSMHRKSTTELEVRGGPAPHPLAKKKKPNTSMLEKVLMNEYVGLNSTGEEGPSPLASLTCLQSLSPNMTAETAHPSPPSLTPVTMNPSSPCTSSMTSPTPPPPVLPTIPSPPNMPSSPLSQPSDCSVSRPLPVLSPKMSPRSIEYNPLSDAENTSLAEGNQDDVGESHNSEQLESAPHSPISSSITPSPSEPMLADLTAEENVSQINSNGLSNGKLGEDVDSTTEERSQGADFAVLSAPSESPTAPSASSLPASIPLTMIKEEPRPNTDDELSDTTCVPHDGVNTAPQSAALEKSEEEEEEDSETFYKTFVCNVCKAPFRSIKELSGHISEHAADWPFKCEFCVQLFGDSPALLTHRTTLHGVGQIFVCSACSKEFAFLCNLQQHQKDLHPNQTCTHTTVESGKLRPQNYTDPSKVIEESSLPTPAPEMLDEAASHSICNLTKEEPDVNGKHGDERPEDPTEELYTTIKIMASEGGKPKGPDVRLGLNQHYPSFKPPPFPYHSRSHAGSVASATNFTTHNIPQTFTTAIRCTKCGNSFDNMPELHKHILACANASDKRRYTPKKNPIPLKQIVKSQNGGLASVAASAGLNAFRRMGQPKRLNFNQEPSGRTKMSALNKKKNQLVQKAISQKNKAASTAKRVSVKVEQQQDLHICPHCNREFKYPASLSKHMAISCPMKPVVKKGKKAVAEVKKEATATVDKNMNLRRKATDTENQQVEPEPEPKPLGKTRARSIAATEPEPSQASKGKSAAPLGRPKRPASFPASPASPGKKGKKGQVQSLPPTPSSSDTPSDAAPRPAMRMQRMGKVGAPKKAAEVRSPPQQPKKEERFSVRTRERVGGPVTRSLQIANTAASVEVKEEPLIQEPKETQEMLMK